MVKILWVTAAVLAAVIGVAVVTAVVATAVWDRATGEVRTSLVEEAQPPASAANATPGAPTADAGAPPEGDSLPSVVARYLERALPPGGPPILTATLEQEGLFQMSEGEAGWRPFTAVQTVRAYPPGFLWDADIRMAPFLPVRVRDGYDRGRGTMKAAVAAVMVMVDAEPTRELAEGALYRYLAEAVWIPTRLLPGEGLTWQAVDDSTALATLRDSELSVSVEFRFDAAGDVTSIFVPERGRDDGGGSVPTPWLGRFWGHADVDGFRVPLEGEVAWVMNGEPVPYWRGRITRVEYATP